MSSSGKAWAVIVAAGSGVRFGAGVPKQFTPLAGKPLVLWSVEAFLGHSEVAGVTVVLPAEAVERPPKWLAELQSVILVAGGAERTDSVRLGLETVPPDIDLVAVHDGARPLISSAAIERVLEAVRPDQGAIGGRRVTDSLKEVDDAERVVAAPDRDRIWRAETPQAFPRDVILDAHRRAEAEGFHASDCAGLCQRYGIEVVMVEIEEPNPKVTRREDLEWVEAWVARSDMMGAQGRGNR
jgi:2-C-methyl-D-erythritol 4-phosphate cytidylyltransferase